MGDNFFDFKFTRHPPCPMCHARHTMNLVYGLPITLDVEPWVYLAGCCVAEEQWICSVCEHRW